MKSTEAFAQPFFVSLDGYTCNALTTVLCTNEVACLDFSVFMFVSLFKPL